MFLDLLDGESDRRIKQILLLILLLQYYNSIHNRHYLLRQAVVDKVFFAAVNFPGSWADGSLTARFLHQMKRRIGHFKICVDQGFPRGGDASGTFVGLVSKRQAQRLHRDVRNYLLRISNVHTLL